MVHACYPGQYLLVETQTRDNQYGSRKGGVIEYRPERARELRLQVVVLCKLLRTSGRIDVYDGCMMVGCWHVAVSPIRDYPGIRQPSRPIRCIKYPRQSRR